MENAIHFSARPYFLVSKPPVTLSFHEVFIQAMLFSPCGLNTTTKLSICRFGQTSLGCDADRRRHLKITDTVVKNIADLTQLTFDKRELASFSTSMSEILELVEQMQHVDTTGVEPMSNPLDATQRLREDVVTEENQRETYQGIAPETEDGLYLVPKVIE
jgi:aspartyl-tRNA(Asn)/glutamyl-tRNA(Gln) amidotransferase subunit C